MIESTSGETYSPHHRKSSPVLTIIVSSSGGTIWRSPSTNLAPPVPPVKTVIMPSLRASPPDLLRPRAGAEQAFASAGRCAPPPALRIQDKPADAGATAVLSPRFVAAVGPGAPNG